MLKIDSSGGPEEPPLVWIEGQGWQLLLENDECRGPGEMSERDRLKEEIGDWLARMGTWDFYFTGTWSKAVSIDGCAYGARRYLDWVEEAAGQKLKSFWGIERGPKGGHLHVHGLIGNVAHLKPYCGRKLPLGKWGVQCCLLHGWQWGICRVESYDPCLGASHYVGKYITKNLAEWQIVGELGVYQNPLFVPPSRRELAAKARGVGPKKIAAIRAEEEASGVRRGERFEWWKAS